jgi:DNA-binding MarR family transcriptional regulator
MEKMGLVRRVRNKRDRRKLHVCLTAKGRAFRRQLIPLAKDVVATAVQGLSPAETRRLLQSLAEIQRNLRATISQFDEIESRLVD